jgi:hypothetical protein
MAWTPSFHGIFEISDIVNIRTRRAVHSINLRFGFALIEIVSPEEVIGDEE